MSLGTADSVLSALPRTTVPDPPVAQQAAQIFRYSSMPCCLRGCRDSVDLAPVALPGGLLDLAPHDLGVGRRASQRLQVRVEGRASGDVPVSAERTEPRARAGRRLGAAARRRRVVGVGPACASGTGVLVAAAAARQERGGGEPAGDDGPCDGASRSRVSQLRNVDRPIAHTRSRTTGSSRACAPRPGTGKPCRPRPLALTGLELGVVTLGDVVRLAHEVEHRGVPRVRRGSRRASAGSARRSPPGPRSAPRCNGRGRAPRPPPGRPDVPRPLGRRLHARPVAEALAVRDRDVPAVPDDVHDLGVGEHPHDEVHRQRVARLCRPSAPCPGPRVVGLDAVEEGGDAREPLLLGEPVLRQPLPVRADDPLEIGQERVSGPQLIRGWESSIRRSIVVPERWQPTTKIGRGIRRAGAAKERRGRAPAAGRSRVIPRVERWSALPCVPRVRGRPSSRSAIVVRRRRTRGSMSSGAAAVRGAGFDVLQNCRPAGEPDESARELVACSPRGPATKAS